jgi:hypothetical protein
MSVNKELNKSGDNHQLKIRNHAGMNELEHLPNENDYSVDSDDEYIEVYDEDLLTGLKQSTPKKCYRMSKLSDYVGIQINLDDKYYSPEAV